MTRVHYTNFDKVRLVLAGIAIPVLILRSAAYLGVDIPLVYEHIAIVFGAIWGLYMAATANRQREHRQNPPLESKPVKDIDEYGAFTEEMWLSGSHVDEKQLTIMSYGLSGETGEVMEILKKRIRDGHFDRDHLRKELGDVAFYWARLCLAFGFKPSEVLGENKYKLKGRRARNALQGSGEDR